MWSFGKQGVQLGESEAAFLLFNQDLLNVTISSHQFQKAKSSFQCWPSRLHILSKLTVTSYLQLSICYTFINFVQCLNVTILSDNLIPKHSDYLSHKGSLKHLLFQLLLTAVFKNNNTQTTIWTKTSNGVIKWCNSSTFFCWIRTCFRILVEYSSMWL